MNSIPQHEVAKGRGQMEFFLASPITLFNDVAKKPSPWWPSGISPKLISPTRGLLFILNDTGLAILILPFQSTSFYNIYESAEEESYEHQYRPKSVPSQQFKVHSIRIE